MNISNPQLPLGLTAQGKLGGPRLYASLQLAKLASPKDLRMPTSVFFTYEMRLKRLARCIAADSFFLIPIGFKKKLIIRLELLRHGYGRLIRE